MKIKKQLYKILSLAILSTSLCCFIRSAQADNIMTNNIISKLDHFIATKSNHPNQISLLFFQKSNTAKIIPNEGDPSCYNLVLTDTKHKIIYFANEPVRTAGSISLSQFLSTWQHNYTQYQLEPNVVINAVIDDNSDNDRYHNKSKELTDIAVFSHPVYDEKNNQLSYTACSISKDKIFVYTRLKDVSLFFDPFHRWPP